MLNKLHFSNEVFFNCPGWYYQVLKFHSTNYNQFHNILRLFDVLPNFAFTTSETMSDYYLWNDERILLINMYIFVYFYILSLNNRPTDRDNLYYKGRYFQRKVLKKNVVYFSHRCYSNKFYRVLWTSVEHDNVDVT